MVLTSTLRNYTWSCLPVSHQGSIKAIQSSIHKRPAYCTAYLERETSEIPPFLLLNLLNFKQFRFKSHLRVCGLFWENMIKIECFLPAVLRISNMDLKLRWKCQPIRAQRLQWRPVFSRLQRFSTFSRNVSFFGWRVALLARPIGKAWSSH